MLKEREAEAKLARAREAREKADKERWGKKRETLSTILWNYFDAVCRSDRAAKKRALVDFNADDNQEGVMDRLDLFLLHSTWTFN